MGSFLMVFHMGILRSCIWPTLYLLFVMCILNARMIAKGMQDRQESKSSLVPPAISACVMGAQHGGVQNPLSLSFRQLF